MAVVAHIILTHASHESEGYTYSVPPELVDELSIGMLVEVEFGNGLAQGILADFAETVAIPDGVKPVLRALTPPLLTPGTIATILRYAHRHMIHVHKVLSLYLPAPYIHRILKYGLLHDRSSAETPVISKPESNPPVKLVYTLSQWESIEYARTALKTRGTVVIVPSEPWIAAILESQIPEWCWILRAQMTDTKRSQCGIDIYSGKFSTLIWTRRLALYNLSRYERILYLEESLFPQILGYFHSYAVRELIHTSAVVDAIALEYVASTPSIDIASRAIAHQFPLTHLRHASPLETPLAPDISDLP